MNAKRAIHLPSVSAAATGRGCGAATARTTPLKLVEFLDHFYN